MAAANSGNVEAARLLLYSGTAIGSKTQFGKTALDVALVGGKTQVAEFLRSGGKGAPLEAQARPVPTLAPPSRSPSPK